jgi:hypothetical protein
MTLLVVSQAQLGVLGSRNSRRGRRLRSLLGRPWENVECGEELVMPSMRGPRLGGRSWGRWGNGGMTGQFPELSEHFPAGLGCNLTVDLRGNNVRELCIQYGADACMTSV